MTLQELIEEAGYLPESYHDAISTRGGALAFQVRSRAEVKQAYEDLRQAAKELSEIKETPNSKGFIVSPEDLVNLMLAIEDDAKPVE